MKKQIDKLITTTDKTIESLKKKEQKMKKEIVFIL